MNEHLRLFNNNNKMEELMFFKRLKKTIKKGELRDVDVDMISLLFDDMVPKNRKGWIMKGVSKKYKKLVKGDKGYLYHL